jgi:hypothetical protein
MSVTRVACIKSDAGGLAEFEVTGTTYSTEGGIFEAAARNLLRQPATQPCLWAAAMARWVWCVDKVVLCMGFCGVHATEVDTLEE